MYILLYHITSDNDILSEVMWYNVDILYGLLLIVVLSVVPLIYSYLF